MPELHVWDGKKSVYQENVSVYFGDFNEVNAWNLLKTLCSKAMVSQPSSLCDELKMYVQKYNSDGLFWNLPKFSLPFASSVTICQCTVYIPSFTSLASDKIAKIF